MSGEAVILLVSVARSSTLKSIGLARLKRGAPARRMMVEICMFPMRPNANNQYWKSN